MYSFLMFFSAIFMLTFLGFLGYFVYLKIRKKQNPKKLGWLGAHKKTSLIVIFVVSLVFAGLAGATPEGREIAKKREAERLMKIEAKNKQKAEEKRKADAEKARKESEAKAEAELKEKEAKAEAERKKKAAEEEAKKKVEVAAPQPKAAPQPRPATQPSQPQPQPRPQPAPQPTESANYSNCRQVREAGRAPIYAGQPGYGTHLDRDGDGVACE